MDIGDRVQIRAMEPISEGYWGHKGTITKFWPQEKSNVEIKLDNPFCKKAVRATEEYLELLIEEHEVPGEFIVKQVLLMVSNAQTNSPGIEKLLNSPPEGYKVDSYSVVGLTPAKMQCVVIYRRDYPTIDLEHYEVD